MRVVETKAALRDALAAPRREGLTIGLVPTMGFLHAGHVSLLESAHAECDVVVMSLFVNPAQFGPGEDLDRYPRDRERDERMAADAGVDLIYAPPTEEVYPEGFATAVEVSGLTEVLCGDPGARGPEHFRGVTTVVAKLFNTVGPDVAYFGQKDAQQAVVIRRMAADLDFPVRIEVRPTVREDDGLALSSRNAYLEPADRERAPALHAALGAAADAAEVGAATADAIAAARRVLAEAGVEPEYLEARDAERLEPIETFNGRPVLLAIAAQVGGARLIDNVIIEPNAPGRTRGA
ncbi:MAG: pantoate--beta-alanine ligase [Solirubrobacterales bacterium]|nr:pantoate--beta-alanine ligase [Solirubrobacterales bacterium]MCB8969838.1 pantoate--beta-alanine ligase [Thermoleophilales bacterium]